MTMNVYTFLCKSASFSMFSYIYMQIVFVYFAIFDMCIYTETIKLCPLGVYVCQF